MWRFEVLQLVGVAHERLVKGSEAGSVGFNWLTKPLK